MLNKLFKSILEQDRMPIVVCDLNDIIVYMNSSAIQQHHRDLTGSSIKACHPPKANEMIDKVVSWFRESEENNIMFTYHNEKKNRDVYMVALRDEKCGLIGYYEKHENRTKETLEQYQPKQ